MVAKENGPITEDMENTLKHALREYDTKSSEETPEVLAQEDEKEVRLAVN
jgi:hypothetical protein